ncbi:MAG TPA: hypothetical protein GXX34_03170 [Clostridia bacterium]|nr:hypothetical protein [Clostridia bacterium]
MGYTKSVFAAVIILMAVFAVIWVLSPMEFSIEALQFQIGIDYLKPGVTEISIPPLGSITAVTHKTPLGITLTLTSIDIDALGRIIADATDQNQLILLVQEKLAETLRWYVLRILGLAFLGGVLGALVLRFDRWEAYCRAGVGGLLVVALLMVMTRATYRVEGFHSPTFNGALEAAPWMVSLAEKAVAQVQELNRQIPVVAGNLYSMLEQIDKLEPVGDAEGNVKVLHVSDIHNHPAALDLIKQMVEKYHVSFVVDTGDLSDYGTVLEGLLTQELPQLSVPYVFIPGNHDSPAIVEALEKYENVIVLNEEVVEIDGIRIFGVADPAAEGHYLISASEEKYPNHTEDLKQVLSTLQVDIIAVHRPKLAHNLAGFAPVILHGHDHSSKVTVSKGSAVIDAGTTGGAGLRRLQVSDDVPLTLALLHLRYDEAEAAWQPAAVDMFSFYERNRKLSVERVLLSN